MLYPRTYWKSLQAEPMLCLRIAELSKGIEVGGANFEDVRVFVNTIDQTRTVKEINGRIIIK